MSKQYKNYSEKKEAQKAGTYHGTSPYFNNIPEFQYLKPLNLYPHLRAFVDKRRKQFDEE